MVVSPFTLIILLIQKYLLPLKCLDKKNTFLCNSSTAVSMLCSFTPAQKPFISQLSSLKSQDLPWSKEQDDISREAPAPDSGTKMGAEPLGRPLLSISCFQCHLQCRKTQMAAEQIPVAFAFFSKPQKALFNYESSLKPESENFLLVAMKKQAL